jgi:hypothetical protein
MREIRTSGSVGAPGEQSPGATRRSFRASRILRDAPAPRLAHAVPRIKLTDCRIRSAGRHGDIASILVVGMCQAQPPLHRQPDAATINVRARHVTSVTLKEPLAGVGPRSAHVTRRSRHRIRGQNGRDTGPDHGGDPRRTFSFPDGTACMRGDISDG